MNVGLIACLLMGGLFLLFAIIFELLKEKAAFFISGFNAIPKQERATYNQLKMSQDMRNSFLVWSLIFGFGALLSYGISSYMALVSFAVWLLLFLKDVHLDAKKAFEKYKL